MVHWLLESIYQGHIALQYKSKQSNKLKVLFLVMELSVVGRKQVYLFWKSAKTNVLWTCLTSHLSTTGCCTQSELFPSAAAFWPSLSPVPSSEWVLLWLPWWPPLGRCADGLLGGRLSSRRSTRFSSSTARTRSSRACCSSAPPTDVDVWATNGESGRGFTVVWGQGEIDLTWQLI